MQLYTGTKGLAWACTGPYNNAQSCPYFFQLKCDVKRTSVTLDVILPSTSSNFQSVHSGVTCTLPQHNGRLAALSESSYDHDWFRGVWLVKSTCSFVTSTWSPMCVGRLVPLRVYSCVDKCEINQCWSCHSHVCMQFLPFSHMSIYTHIYVHTHKYMYNTLFSAHMQHCSYSQFLMPGLVDCHIHGEQIMNAGANYDKSFIDWLIQDFFPSDLQFRMDPAYARNVSSLIVVRML